jgi:hypothetical protein
MSKAKNYILYGDDEYLRRMKAEADYIGRECEIQGDKLVIFALPQKKKANKKDGKRGQRRSR